MFDAREDISGLLERGTFPYKGDIFKRKKEKTEEKSEKKSEEESKEKIKDEYIKYIENEWKDIHYDLFKDYFDFSVPSVLAKQLYETKTKKQNDKLVEKN